MFKEVELLNNILVIGDIMLDKFVYGNVSRISPEAPIPILKYTTENYMIGGCGNVALNINTLGGRSNIISYVADDASGKEIKHIIGTTDIIDNIQISDIKTTTKTRYISNG